MAIKVNILTGLLYCIALFLLTGCPARCINESPIYNFPAEAHFTPEKDSIQVGDTLYLVSEIQKKLMPYGSQELIDYSNARISGSLSVVGLNTNRPHGTDAVFDFDYISINGQIYNSREIPKPDGFQQFIYQELADKYTLKIGFIPKRRGVYGLGILSTASLGRSGNGCDKASFKVTVSNADIHDHYLKEFTGSSETPRPSNGYYFKVY